MLPAEYRAWERSQTTIVVHVMQMEYGDGSAANRLTFTDRPYYDKGVSGAKYHDTHPAPHHCIMSDIVCSETRDNTSFDDIVISNVDGRYDGLAGDADLVGQPFVILRGDASWSLMETDWPHRFVEIMRGQILGAHSEDGGSVIRLNIGPIKYDLDIRIGLEGFPKGFGMVFGAPLTLISSADNRYKFNSFPMRDTEENLEIYDAGVLLVHPDNVSPDYTIYNESGPGGVQFYGAIELASPPAGQLTANYNLDYSSEALRNIRFIMNGAVDVETQYPIAESIDASAIGQVFTMQPGELRFYIVDKLGTGVGAGVIREFTLSSAGDLGSWTSTGASKDLFALCTLTVITGLHVNAAETRLYVCGRDGSTRKVCLCEFGTPGDPSTLTLHSSKTIIWVGANLSDIWVSPDETVVMLMTVGGMLHQQSCSVGDITTLTDDEVSIDCRQFDIAPWGFDIANGGHNLYVCGTSNAHIWQIDLVTANSLEEWVFARRADNHSESVPYIDPFHLHVSATDLYVMNGSSFINRTPLLGDAYNMPRNPVDSNLYNTDCEVWAGVHYTSPTPYGQAITDLAASLHCKWCVDRLGTIRLTQLKAPEAAETFEPNVTIGFSDLIGTRNEAVRQAGTDLPARSVHMSYRRNVMTLSETEILGTPTQDEKYLFSNPVKTYTVTNTLADYVRSEDEYIDAFTAVSNTNSQAMAARIAALRDVPRYRYEIQADLRAISLIENWNIGNMITVQGDWQHPDFADGDVLQCISRTINFSKRMQTLEVFR